MALVMKSDNVKNLLETKMIVTNGKTVNITVDGVNHMDIITYPPQGDFVTDIILAVVYKPFIDFAKSCGKAGAMTTDRIIAKYGNDVPKNMASSLAADFAKAYGNYVIIPDGMALLITASPIASVFDIMVKEEEPTEE